MSTIRDTADKAHRLFDVRTIERNIKKGMTTRKDYEKHLKALADAADKVAPFEEHPDDEAAEESQDSDDSEDRAQETT